MKPLVFSDVGANVRAGAGRWAGRGLVAWLVLVLGVGFVFTSRASAQVPLSTTYQGQLTRDNAPVTGVYDMQFRIFTARTGGVQIGTTLCADDVKVTDGLFTVVVPLPALNSGQPAYLDVSTRLDTGEPCGVASGYTPLSPRQLIAAVPVAVSASVITQKSPSVEGALRYNPTAKRFEGFTGVFWVPLTQGAEMYPDQAQFFAAGAHEYVVPEGVTRIGVDVCGGGGGGGGRAAGSLGTGCITPGPTAGYGGGSGAAVRAFIDVTPGETLKVIVGDRGLGGPGPGDAGTDGGDSIIRRETTDLVIAGGGKGGRAGVLALNAQFGNPCASFAPSQNLTGRGGSASAPGPGVTVIASFNGGGGSPPALGLCNGSTLTSFGCAGSGAAARVLGAPINSASGYGGNGAPFAQTGSGLFGGSGSVLIWTY